MKSEFEFIQHLKKKYSLKYVGDDCAILPKDDKTDMVVTADMLVEDIDFRLDWTTPEFLGHKALAVSLSDIAAMGADPKWAMLSIGVPENLWKKDFVERFYEGWHKLAGEFKVELVGGDISRTPDKLVVDSTVCGEVPTGTAVLRSGAEPGDSIYVTGRLGGAAGGLSLLESVNGEPHDEAAAGRLIKRQLCPNPQLIVAQSLRAKGFVHSMIDVSDGLASDLEHICFASSVGAKIYAERIHIHYDLKHFFDESVAFEFAVNGGEDFEIVFSASSEKINTEKLDEISCIGEITSNAGIIELICNGKSEILEPKGYRHF